MATRPPPAPQAGLRGYPQPILAKLDDGPRGCCSRRPFNPFAATSHLYLLLER